MIQSTGRSRSVLAWTVPALVVGLVLSSPTLAFAQAGGSIAGTVKDQSGGVIPGATVTLTNRALGTLFTATTDGQGLYAFPNVPVGRYDLAVNLEGFKPLLRLGLAVDINSRRQADATLELGTQSETVTVTRSPSSAIAKATLPPLGEF